MSTAPDLARLRLDYARAKLLAIVADCRVAVACISEEEGDRLCAPDLYIEARRLSLLASEALERLAMAEGRVL